MNDTSIVLLVAERDEQACEFLVGQFAADGFEAHSAQSAEEARVKLARHHPELLVLGELDGPHASLELLRGIRAGGLDGVAVIVVSPDCSLIASCRSAGAVTARSTAASWNCCLTSSRSTESSWRTRSATWRSCA